MADNSNELASVEELFKDVRRGAGDLVRGGELVDVGRGMIAASLLLIAAQSEEYRTAIVQHASNIVQRGTDDATKQRVALAKEYFRDLFVGATSPIASRLKQVDEEDRTTRERHNNKVVALDAAATFAAFCVITVNHYKVWQSLAPAKKKGSIRMMLAGASIVWPDKRKTFDEMDEKAITINNRAGAWRMSALETRGKEIAQAKGWREAPKVKATPLRDAALTMSNSIEGNDAKVLNNAETRLAAFAALVHLVDVLNIATVKGHLPSEVVKPFRDCVLTKIAETEKERDDALRGAKAAA